MIRRPPRSTLSSSSAASDVYKRQVVAVATLVIAEDIARRQRRESRQRTVLLEHARNVLAEEEVVIEVAVQRTKVILPAHVGVVTRANVEVGLRSVVEEQPVGVRGAVVRVGVHLQQEGHRAVQGLARVQGPLTVVR